MLKKIRRLRENVRALLGLAPHVENPVRVVKYLPTPRSPDAPFSLRRAPRSSDGTLPVPPRDLWLGYGASEAEYLESGRQDANRMIGLLAAHGLDLAANVRSVLDLGCGGGRMIRHLEPFAGHTEIWGMDISAAHINWLKMHLAPPFHFAVNTTIPHLPFSDGHFGLVYCGSVFTHIDDLAEAWFLECRRVLAPGGILYCTLHDEHTRAALEREPHHPVARMLQRLGPAAPEDTPDVLVVGRDSDSNVFYRASHVRSLLEGVFEVLAVEPRAYGYQSAWILRRR